MGDNQLESEQRCTAQMQNTPQPVPSQCSRQERTFCLKSFSHVYRKREKNTHPVGGAVDQSSAGREREREKVSVVWQ